MSNEFNSVFAHNLTRTREARHITQEEAAAHLGMSKKLYAAYENGRKIVRSGMLVKLAEYFNVTCDSLINEFMTVDELCRQKSKELSESDFDKFITRISASCCLFTIQLLGKDCYSEEKRKHDSIKRLELFLMQGFKEVYHDGDIWYIAKLSPYGTELLRKELSEESGIETPKVQSGSKIAQGQTA